MLTEFFVVTLNTVYRILYREHARKDKQVLVQPLKKRHYSPAAQTFEGESLRIGKRLIMNASNLGNSTVSTSEIVGLFLQEKEACACARVEGSGPYDQRWERNTRAVLEQIHADHPVFEKGGVAPR